MIPDAAICEAGAAAVRAQEYTRAEQLLTECTQSKTATLESFLMLAGVHQARKDESALLATAREGLKRFPEEKRFYLTAGTISGRRAQFHEAVTFLEAAWKRWPDDAKIRSLLESALAGRGARYLDTGENASAADDLRRAVALSADDVEAWMNLGRAQQNLLRYADAFQAFGRVVTPQPAFPLVHFHRGLAQYSLGEFDAAIRDMDAQVRADPDYPPSYLIRGLSHLSLGQWEQAVPDLELAATRMPDDPQAHSGLGRALLRTNRLADAEQHLRKAILLNPKDATIANTLVGLLIKRGKREEARELARKAAELARERR